MLTVVCTQRDSNQKAPREPFGYIKKVVFETENSLFFL